MNRKFLNIGIALVAFSMIFVSCTVAATPTSAPAAAEAKAPAGPTGKFVWMMQGAVLADFDPINHNSLPMLWSELNVYDRLVEVNDKMEFMPNLATEWKQIDPLTIEFKLRKGVKFHDGSAFTGKDVKATYERTSDPKIPAGSWWPSGQVTVDVIDDLTIRVKSKTPSAPLMFSIAFCPIAPAAYEKDLELFKKNGQMGTGPFKFVSNDTANEIIHYTANMDYWAGPPKIKDLDIVMIGDPNTMLAALQAGEADVITRPDPDHVALIEKDPKLYTIESLAIEQMFLGFKTELPPMDNPLVRQAIAYAINKEAIVKDFLLGQGRVADSHLSISSYGYAVPSNNITYNPAKAKELLKQAGYEDPAKMGEIKLGIMLGFYAKAKEYGEYIVQNLKDIGINATAYEKEVGALYTDLIAPKPLFHMWMTGFFPSSPEPDLVLYTLFKSPGLLSRYSSVTLDAALAAENQEVDPVKRAQILKDVTLPQLMKELPEYPLFTSMFILGVNKRVQGLSVGGTGAMHLHDVSLLPK